MTGVIDRAGIEGRFEHGMAQVRQLVEQPDREVGDDDRDVDDREAPSPQPVGERKHPTSLSPASLGSYRLRPRLTTRLTLLPVRSNVPDLGRSEITRPFATTFE